jgi:hypothetical protein
MTFDSYHWRSATLGTSELEEARLLISEKHDCASFELLLRSDDIAAVGIALDQFQYREGLSRWGTDNPFAEYRDEVATRARAVLRDPPSPGSDRVKPGASHASALNALTNLAEPEDAEFVLRALDRPLTADLQGAALVAASRVLERASLPNEQLMAALEKMVFDESLGLVERVDALSSLAGASSLRTVEILKRVLQLPHVKLQAHAGLHLLDRDHGAHRGTVERTARTWPTDPPYPADEVLEALDPASDQVDPDDADHR